MKEKLMELNRRDQVRLLNLKRKKENLETEIRNLENKINNRSFQIRNLKEIPTTKQGS